MRQHQRGVALIIALVLVALATILATKIGFDGYLERQRTVGVLAVEQALQFGMGAEALAADGLNQSANSTSSAKPGTGTKSGTGAKPGAPANPGGGAPSGQVTLADPWAQPIPPIPITPESNPDGEPIGTIEGTLEDMEGRFNLNNLARVDAAGKPDPQPVAQFRRLLISIELEPEWAEKAADWIDADDQPRANGAEDALYTSQDPPYKTGNWPMMSPTELMNLPGFGAERYRKIAPYVTALPTATAKINVCTASGVVLDSMADNMNEYSHNLQLLVASRKTGCFPEKSVFLTIVKGDSPKDEAQAQNWSEETSNYFRLTTHVTLGTTEFTLYSLLHRPGPAGKFTPVLRSFGSL